MLRLFCLPLVALALLASFSGADQKPALKETAKTTSVESAINKEKAALEKDRLRILTLRSGQMLRTRAKFQNSQWLVKHDGGWNRLPAGFVVESATVKSLLREARKLERGLKLSKPDQRAELALWLAEHGLYNEALSHLDINLRKDPDHQPTLAIINRGLIRVNLDKYLPPTAPGANADVETWIESIRKLFESLSRLSPATREIAFGKIRTIFCDEARMPAFIASATVVLGDRSSARRKVAAGALQRLAIDDLKRNNLTAQTAVKTLIRRASLDGTGEVRAVAARALRDMNEIFVTLPLVKALGSKSTSVRANSAEALGVIGAQAVAPALVSALSATTAPNGDSRPAAANIFVGRQVAYIQDFDVEAFSFAVAGDPQVNVLTEGAVLDVRVLSISQRLALVNERSKLRGALRKLLGQDFRYDTKKWNEWIVAHPNTNK